MKTENLTQLAEWLEDGAPHIVFSMSYGILPIEDLDGDYPEFEIERDEKGLGPCGTVCCIAGYAAKKLGDVTSTDDHWPEIRDSALEVLGLPDDQDFFGHDLFNPHLAPRNCTPQRAAQAVRNVIGGLAPWNS